MNLRYGLQSSKDLFGKLEADAVLIENEVTSYKLFDFVVTAYHFYEWIEKDRSVPASAKSDIANVRQDQNIAICRDLANATKHFELRKSYSNPVASTADSAQGFGVGRYDHGGYDVGEEEIVVTLLSGQQVDALQLTRDVLSLWRGFFQKHGI
ncbi:MAG: hypothetical protein ACREYE_27935 [Gammaproteobacteria bacterium]